ncbi:MAG: hypothetical protein V2I33_24660 [Kangiellaceae bacterium]|jgi:hypothetical protein|nr:hypothetical protein [Kangiellaceae bacterium]
MAKQHAKDFIDSTRSVSELRPRTHSDSQSLGEDVDPDVDFSRDDD